MLELRNVSKRFSGSLAVDNVSFCARAGEVTGYLGPNGSGKSTTIKMIAGLIDTTSGEISFNGHSDSARPDRLETAHGLRARGAASVRAPLGPGIPRHGRSVARPAGAAHGRSHRWTAPVAGAPRRPARGRVGLFERHAPEGAPGRGAPAQSRSPSAGRTVFRARRRHRARVAQPDPGTGRPRQGRALQLSRARNRRARLRRTS